MGGTRGPAPEVTLDDVVDVFANVREPYAPLTATEVATALDCARRTAHRKLEELTDRGELRSKKTGARSRVWWRPPPGDVSWGRGRIELDEPLNRMTGVFTALDADWRITYLNENSRRAIVAPLDEELSREELLGRHLWRVNPNVSAADVRTTKLYRSCHEAMERQEMVSYERYLPDADLWVYTRVYPSETGVSIFSQDITDRKESERELERQREQLAALDELNGVVREITRSVIEQSTRKEIERVVCERLASSDSYRFAWLCGVDTDGRLEPRVEAGVEGYLDAVSLSIEPDDPIGRAVRTQEMQVVEDYADARSRGEYARAFGYRTSAAIPIVHEHTLYGVIGLYSARADAFEAAEREVIGALGEVVGHAIAAIVRERALMSDEVVELEFRTTNLDALSIPAGGAGTVVVDRLVPLGDDSYLGYGVTTDDGMEVVYALVDAAETPLSRPVDVIETSADETRFELGVTDSPLVSAIVGAGGHVREVRVDERGYALRIHLPPSADVRAIGDLVAEAFPGAAMVTRHQTTRSRATPQQMTRIFEERLTERQRAALEAGYFGGFYEWPRHSSGGEVASSLGIGVSTFHQHLRRAEKKLLDVVFETEPTDEQ